MKIFKYTADELSKIENTKEILIHNWLHRGDLMFVKAQKKVGKSIFVQCMAHSASMGTPFLDEYIIDKPLKVAYLFSEGALVDWKERVINMNKMYKYDNDNLIFFQCCFPRMHTEQDREVILETLKESEHQFDLLIWDCLYKFLFGTDTNDSVAVGMFNANEEYIRSYFNAASVIVHHDTEKKFRDKVGGIHSMATPGSAMGSSYLLANVTQVYTIEKHKFSNGQEYNKIVLGDKRSGDLTEELIYYNVVPEDDGNEDERLGITLDQSETCSNYAIVKFHLKDKGKVKRSNLKREIGANFSRETMRRIINKLVKEKVVERQKIDNINYYVWVGG